VKKLLACILVAAACGCATVRYCDNGGKTMVDITNTGWYLFNVIPLASGNPDAPNECSCKLFRQTTTLANNTRLLDFAMTEKEAETVKSVSSYHTDESVLFLLLKRHACHTSAELVMQGGKDLYR
jgi:hypothetical protein